MPKHPINPLRRLPSVLAMPDLQKRLSRVLRDLPLGEDEMAALLRLDPLAVVRGMRAAGATVFRQHDSLPTVPGIVRALGPSLSKRLFRQPFTEVRQKEQLQALWRHSVATAIAAEELATQSGVMEPDVAYLTGLLHDLPDWLEWLEAEAPGDARPRLAPTDWILRWQLPAPFVSLLLAVQIGGRARTTEQPPDPASLVRGAELIAELAGYRQPQQQTRPDEAWFEQLRADLDDSQAALVQLVHRRMDAAMRSFGFSPEITAEEVDACRPSTVFDLSGTRLDEVVLSILRCTRAESYRGIVTAVLAAAVRYGHYDRAFYAKWVVSNQRLILRSKADSSARSMVLTTIPLDDAEIALLEHAMSSQTSQLLHVDTSAGTDLLRTLSTDELLIVPLNHEFATPAFLLLDRSLTMQPLDLDDDLPLASVLSMTGTLLNQNLLLRRSHQRSQKFALTDSLTRLFNRRMGIHALEQAISRTERDGQPLTVLMCDLDHFKQLNDTLGHQKGDEALRATADVLRQVVRRADSVCRYGGEEFLVVLPDTTPDEATVLAARMFTAVHARGEHLGLPMTISIGLTSYRPHDNVESILLRADRALYASKGYGRNRFSADIEGDETTSREALLTPGDDPATAPDDAGSPDPERGPGAEPA